MTATAAHVSWVLTDWYGSQYGDHEYPKLDIRSADALRAALEDFARQEPRLLDLDCSDGFRVGLGIGGPLGVVQVHCRREGSLIAVADVPQATEEKCFVGDWQPSHFLPRHLLPVGEVIEIALELYRTRLVPKQVKWEH